ncbi:MAG TPA: serine hydrolase, partial [Acidimicrobiales bacterium]|nr:serine hydrolase [Acidimicrobiales bacterium]
MVVASVLAGCADDASTTTPSTTAPVEAATMATMQATLDQVVADNPTLHGVVVHVIAPSQGIDESVASGENVGGALSPDATFRLASNTKTFTAATVLRLV